MNSSGELECDECHEAFVEEVPADCAQENHPSSFEVPTSPPSRPGTSSRIDDVETMDLPANALGGIEDIIQGVFSRYGGIPGNGSSPVQIFMSTAGIGGGEGGSPLTIGDYAVGNIDSILNRILQSESHTRTPAASKKFIASLPKIAISADQEKAGLDCSVCKEKFKENESAHQLPCGHWYHPDCILPWLERNNTCPLCRFSLPTDSNQSDSNGVGARSTNVHNDDDDEDMPDLHD